MRFVNAGNGWVSAFPNPVDAAAHAAGNAIGDTIAQMFVGFSHWLVTDGLLVASEIALVFGMGCVLVAISGSGKWLERGVKYIVFAVGMSVAHAVGMYGGS